MFFTVNIGNTNTAAAIVDAEGLTTARRRTASLRKPSAVRHLLARLLRNCPSADEPLEGAILASVVPAMLPLVTSALTEFTGRAPLVLDRKLDTGIDLSGYRGLLGADRIAACAGGAEACPGPFVVIDLGTATTMSAVDGHHRFAGGLICPGLQMGLEALSERTAQLPDTSLESRPPLFGQDTRGCLVSGAVHGSAAIVDGVGASALTELGPGATVVLTGGNARRVVHYLHIPVLHEPELVLQGLAATFRRHVPAPVLPKVSTLV
ncbi:type III pantothenate kinase [Propionibacterium sp.]|uniref:type III pantothenate kinase n=1 Tax=Propionibacterium sp. TaxID=1977903 RepID=UPI0039EC6B9B